MVAISFAFSKVLTAFSTVVPSLSSFPDFPSRYIFVTNVSLASLIFEFISNSDASSELTSDLYNISKELLSYFELELSSK